MGFNIANDSLQEAAFIVAVVGTATAILATTLRFVATKISDRKVSWEDLFAVLATFSLITYIIPFIYILSIMNGQNARELSRKDLTNLTKAGYVMAPQFCLQQLFAKLSLLFLYYRLYWVSRPFVRCIYFLGLFQLLWSIATFVAHWAECTPTRKEWDPKVPGHCINAPVFLAAGETPNSLVDFALVGLGMWIAQALRMKLSVRVKLAILFAIGGLAGILGFVKIGEGFNPMKTLDVELYDPIWSIVQQTCSVICCCAPLYKPLIPTTSLFDMLQSFSGRTFGRRSAPSTEEDKISAVGSGEDSPV